MEAALDSRGHEGTNVGEIWLGLQIKCCIGCFFFFFTLYCTCLSSDGLLCSFSLLRIYSKILFILFYVEIMKVGNTPSEVTCTFFTMLRNTSVTFYNDPYVLMVLEHLQKLF